jgi:hypothetical protein
MEDKINSIFKGAGSALRAFADGVKKNVIDIQVPTVIDILNKIVIKKTLYVNEKKVEDFICAELNNAIGRAHSQYNIGGYLGLRVDIDLGDGQVGIELKLAKELATTNIERLFGQVIYYSKRVYKDKLIVVIVGTDKEYTPTVKEVEKFINELGVSFVYLKIQ